MAQIFKYLFKRILCTIPILIGISLISFMLGILAPGDPAREILTRDGISQPTKEEVYAMREDMGLNDPILTQYVRWVKKAIKCDLGKSYITDQPVFDELVKRIPITFSISIFAVIIAILLGIPLGVIMAVKNNSYIDNVGRIIALIFISIPGFWFAFVLITIFSEKLKLLPTNGIESFKSLIMPSFILASGTIGVIMRLTRANVLKELNKNYIITAESKGLSYKIIVVKHAFLNSLLPIITLIGNYFAGILGGTAVIESIFAIPGMGSFAIEGIFNRDYPVIQGYVLFAGIVYIVFNLLIDLSYLILNPKIRLGGES
ncbi:peptide/nickel transport system permease protein [Clostridium tetanomorphum]|uniref:Nickel import system permease protein NikB n=1 Tax=Clostridium tetanomorphum TaxID=1553 RepID=A0A923IYX2_CLOTT|nr:nickel ABC transporter permease [Clostridium tetanomorphum]KAJ50990.1 transport system permease, nickel or dipeptide [Clostridium tetanomorphum DSM 665]MBC2396357.1 ABC transporter permease [Clostridium tetanomorphum]MBP1863414.1 peptide/nickel transport system permease protein [Clostridium tetanomorphum]NRS83511.1 peptide/nickel transport system permease protein [Clostridium tetanomorphum]NRZ96711.1 peptide/nickel transport system permease protein [Clostridium tetanomorphum]